jgi:hypothetical protein
MRCICVRAALAALCALSLSGCIDSASPILSDSQQLFGPQATFQLYGLRKGFAVEPERATFSWDGGRYVRKSGGLKDVHAFSVHPFEGDDYIVQSAPAKKPDMTEYAVMHRLTDGVYQVVVIDETDADEPTRTAHCDKGAKNDRACRIKTRDQLLLFARATAARRKDDGGLAIRLQDDQRSDKRRR